MLDLVCVFRKTGAQLWSKSWVPGALKGNPVDALIHHVLLEVRALVIAQHSPTPLATPAANPCS